MGWTTAGTCRFTRQTSRKMISSLCGDFLSSTCVQFKYNYTVYNIHINTPKTVDIYWFDLFYGAFSTKPLNIYISTLHCNLQDELLHIFFFEHLRSGWWEALGGHGDPARVSTTFTFSWNPHFVCDYIQTQTLWKLIGNKIPDHSSWRNRQTKIPF